MGIHWKIWFLGGCMKNQYIGGEMPKMRGLECLQIWNVCRGGLAKKRGGCFWGGVEIPMHTMSWRSLLIDTNIQTNNIVTH